jgi:hypothetical protein
MNIFAISVAADALTADLLLPGRARAGGSAAMLYSGNIGATPATRTAGLEGWRPGGVTEPSGPLLTHLHTAFMDKSGRRRSTALVF